MELHLEDEEASLLLRLIRNRRNDMRDEVRHFKDSEMREYLKHKERILNRILEKFPPGLDEKAHMRGHILPKE